MLIMPVGWWSNQQDDWEIVEHANVWRCRFSQNESFELAMRLLFICSQFPQKSSGIDLKTIMIWSMLIFHFFVLDTDKLYQAYGNWDPTFYLAGSAVMLTGILGLISWLISWRTERRHHQDTSSIQEVTEEQSSEPLLNHSKSHCLYQSIQ